MDSFLKSPRSLSFLGPDKFSELYSVLQSDYANTEIVPVTSMEQLLLRLGSGTTVAGRLAISRPAFQQLCGVIAPGLYNAMNFSYWKSAWLPSEKLGMLGRAYNNVVKLRFSQLPSLRLLVDRRTNEIVGVMTSSYKIVMNYDLVQNYASAISAGKIQFVEGRVEHRELMATFVRVGCGVSTRAIDWQPGLAIINSESSRVAIHAPIASFDSLSGSFSLEPPYKHNRLIHRKTKGFMQKLDGIITDSLQSDTLQKKLQDAGLVRRFWQPCRPASDAAKWSKRFKKRLSAEGVHSKLIDRVLEYAFGTRQNTTWYQLYSIMLSVADESRTAGRPLRFCAYRILFGVTQKKGK
ncbi:MAG: hypothetical protein KatS3mg109_0150 [Pirellulaceae bacterium]|nr:MAG: hypothetical protein KatS3mg109_0150 [Pirellulaceae bacterium]